MKVLVIVAGLLCFHQSLATDCGNGPVSWCVDRHNAARCGREAYCAENCWSYVGRPLAFAKNQMIKFNQVPQTELAQLCTSANLQLSVRSTVCNECKVIIGDLDKLLKNKQSLESLVAAMRFFCNFLPAYSTLCREIVTDIGDMVGGLEPYLNDSEKACEKIKMCPKPKPAQDSAPIPALASLIHNTYLMNTDPERNNTVCEDCQEACGIIIAQLQDPAQQENLKETFEELCDYVGPLKRKCLTYIDQFVPQLIDWIISRFTDPLALCTQLGFCR